VNFAFGEDQELLRTTTRRFLEDRQPISSVRKDLEAADPFDAGIWRQGAELGWTAMLVPGDYDGGSVTDQPLVDLIVLAEELGRVLNPGPFIPTNVVVDAIVRGGSDLQRKELLPSMAAGQLIAAWCLSGDGTVDNDAIEVVATADGDGYRLDGVARYVQAAQDAGLLLVAARAGDEIINLLVPRPSANLSDRVMIGLDLTRRFSEVRFDGVGVPGSAVLAGGGAVIERALALATVLQAGEIVGAADHLFEVTVQYAKDRIQFGRAIGSFQAIKHRLANLVTEVEAMRAGAHYAALALGDGLSDAAEAVAAAGAYIPEAFAHLCGEALQIHGGIGFTWEHDVHLYLRRAKTDQVLYGDAAWHRERLCGLIEASTPDEES
jgi:alkylation response protein AidB-like acyl-CoA dehydrogenase